MFLNNKQCVNTYYIHKYTSCYTVTVVIPEGVELGPIVLVAIRALFGFRTRALCNRALYIQVYELLHSQCIDNGEGTLGPSDQITIYHTLFKSHDYRG